MADFLLKEIERKRKERDELTSKLGHTDKKYIKRADLEKLREEQHRNEQQRKEEERNSRLSIPSASTDRPSASPSQTSRTKKSNSNATPEIDDDFLLPNKDVIDRLRAIDQPTRLFAETDKERMKRLRALESQYEERSGMGGHERNEWRKALEATNKGITAALLMKSNSDNKDNEDDNERGSKKRKKDKDEDIDTAPISLELYEKEPDTCRKLLRVYLRRMIQEWEEDVLSRDDYFKSSQQGRLQTTTMHQSLEYMKPFFKALKKREMPVDVEARLAEICHWTQKREYQRANDVYLRMSIGNAPWPIGVTMVGIHERSGREKIFSSNVAHALNDETQRKWIQSLKRLMTWLQQKHPPDDLAKLMG